MADNNVNEQEQQNTAKNKKDERKKRYVHPIISWTLIISEIAILLLIGMFSGL